MIRNQVVNVLPGGELPHACAGAQPKPLFTRRLEYSIFAFSVMNGLNLQDRAELRRTLQALVETTNLVRNWEESVRQSQRHDHTVTVWIVGLCAGGVAVIGHVVSPFFEIRSASILKLAFLYGPFVFGILFGIAHSFILTRLMEAGSKFLIYKISAFVAIHFRNVQAPSDIKKMKFDIWAITEDKDALSQARMKELGIPNLQIWLNRVQHLPMIMFGTGVIVVVFAVFWVRGVTIMSGIYADWVEPLQAVLAVAGSWFLAFGITHTIKMKIGGQVEQVTSTSKPAVRTGKFWWGLVLISLAGLPPVVRFLWRLWSP